MHGSRSKRAIVITIRSGKAIDDQEARGIADRVSKVMADGAYTVAIEEFDAGARPYIGTRPRKDERIAAIERMPPGLSAEEIAKRIGMSSRQVKRYRVFLRALAGNVEAVTLSPAKDAAGE